MALAALEIGLRMAGFGPGDARVQYISHPDLFSVLAPDQDAWAGEDDPSTGRTRYPVHVNAHGQRGPDYPLEKPAGEFRVIVLGDSMTYGLGVRDEETFPALLEERCSASGRDDVRVVNAGVAKYATYNYLRWIETQAERFDPDLIVVACFMGNDMGLPTRSIMSIPVPMENVLRRSALAYWVYMKYRLRRAKRDLADQMGKPFEQIEDADLLQFAGVEDSKLSFQEKVQLWEHSLTHFEGMKAAADELGVPLVCLLVPTQWMLGAEEGQAPIPGWLSKRLGDLGIPVVSPMPELEPLGEQAYLVFDPGHFSVAGHEATAAALERGLAEHGLLEPAGP